MPVKSGKGKFAVLFAVAALAGGVIYYALMKGEEQRDYIEATGVIEATEVELTPKISGRIEWLCCVEGGSVKAGELAVRLESVELKARLEEGRANIAGAEEGIQEAKVSLENAKVQKEASVYEAKAAGGEAMRVKALLNDAKENLDRANGLFKDGYISKKDLDAARTAFEANTALLSSANSRKRSAEANARAAAVNIKAASARISSAEAKRAQAEAQLNVILAELKDTEIYSPIDGVVVYKTFEAGEIVNAGGSIYTINDLKGIWARVDIEETEVRKIALGNRTEIRAAGHDGKEYPGKVIEIGEVGGFATQRDVTRGRSDIKTFRVKASVQNPDGSLKPGMTVTARIFFNK